MDAKLIEVYDLNEESASKKLESGISKNFLKRSGINQKIILSTIFNHWLKELISANYKIS